MRVKHVLYRIGEHGQWRGLFLVERRATPQLHSACAGTRCVAVDYYDNFYSSSDGTTWTATPVNVYVGLLYELAQPEGEPM